MLAHPDVGPALAAAGLGHAALEGVPGAVRVDRGGLGLAEQVAEIEKMLLGGRAFGEIGPLPFGDEVLREHARPFSKGPNRMRRDGGVILLLADEAS
jgi:hypothetical protein